MNFQSDCEKAPFPLDTSRNRAIFEASPPGGTTFVLVFRGLEGLIYWK